MGQPTIHVVGLGPAGPEQLTEATRRALRDASVARLRTRRHPAACEFEGIDSYDDLYDEVATFEDLYDAIVTDLVALAHAEGGRQVVYAVPGSPVVAERTVELLVARDDVTVKLEPAVSVIEVACARLARDPMAAGLRIVDALNSSEPLRGPGPLLVLQTHSPEVLAVLASRLAPDVEVRVLHHLGADDEEIVTTTARDLWRFDAADHLTSVWIETLRTAGAAVDDLVALTHTLRQRCVWDQEQTHESLLRHLLEEAYEAMDAIERYVATDEFDPAEVVEELGDVLFQIVFHCELGVEEGRFDLTAVADRVHAKLVSRHPHVFADAVVADAAEAAERWETLKRVEKGRDSVTDGVPLQLPSLTLYAKMRRKALAVRHGELDGADARERALVALDRITVGADLAGDVDTSDDGRFGDLLEAVSDLGRYCGVDLEATLRTRALALRDEIVRTERESFENGGSTN